MNTAQRWVFYAVAALGTAGAMAWVDRRDAEAVPATRVAATAKATPKREELAVAALPQRRFTEPAIDPFVLGDAPAVAEAPPQREQILTPFTPAVPPLPYAYVGRWIENGATVAFLTTPQGINVAARAGATLDGSYLVEAIDPQGITFKVLPLGQRQRLSFADAPPASAAAPTGQAPTAAVNEPEEGN